MRSLSDSLAKHVASLSQADFDALMDARPDVVEALFGDAPEGAALQAEVGSVVRALSDPEGVFEILLGLSRSELQVLMALHTVAISSLDKRTAQRLGQFRYQAEYELGSAHGSRYWDMLPYYGVRLEADVRVAREMLCGRPETEAASDAAEKFDRIVARLTEVCLVWPEGGTGRLRLHDVLLSRLPDPTQEWRGFDPAPPVLKVARQLPVERVDAEAQAVATAALEGCERLLRQIACEAVPLLKAGGVGVREIKRLVRVCGLDEAAVRFWLTVANDAGLVVCQDGKLLATPEYDQWISAGPHRRYAELFNAWVSLPTSVLGPFAGVDQSGKPPAPLSEAAIDGIGQYVRTAVLEMVTACGPGVVPDPGSLAETVRWRLPLVMQGDDFECDCGEHHGRTSEAQSAAAVTTVLTEGALLGAVALGAAAPLVRIAFDTTPSDDSDVAAAVAAALAATLPDATERVRLQGDMTVVATGLPSAKLAAFFDATADRESAGNATIWRIGDGSVRRWLDAGRSAEDLLAGLAEFCEDTLPQALRYLIEDAARRHGLVDVVAARAVVVAADAQLGAELAVLPALVSLGARKVADTVLVANATQEEVLKVLRFAGYLPSAHKADGSPSGTIVAAPRASPESAFQW
ncbi:MAG: hypothetical protein HOV87_09290 [Catenulispora sp.]|nr:hypothetical protein [Catenulispora sp.]